MTPAAASSSPASTLSRLVLPTPLRPTRPTLSPVLTVKLASLSTRRAATSMASPRDWIMAGPNVTYGCRRRFVPHHTRPRRRLSMKKGLVVVAFLVLAAACGGGHSGRRPTSKEGPGQPVAQGDGSRGTGVPGETSNGGGTTTPPRQPGPPPLGPPAVRPAPPGITLRTGKVPSQPSQGP